MDLIVVLILTLISVPLIYWEPLNYLRIALGLLLILFFPGYTLIASLFPRKGDLDGIERVALAIGLSLALIPIIGLVLNFSPWGISFGSILAGSSLWITLLGLIAIYRRTKAAEFESIKVQFVNTKSWMSQHRRAPDLAVMTLIILASTVLILAISWRIQSPPPGEPFTEFYVLGETGMLQDYPNNLSTGTSQNYRLGIINFEKRETSYIIKARLNKEAVGKEEDIQLDAGAQWEGEISITPTIQGIQEKLIFELYRDKEETPYRKLHLYVDVRRDSNNVELP